MCEAREEQLTAAVAERDNWIETARMHAKNEAYYRDLIVTTLAGTPAAFVSDDGSAQRDVLCAKLPELYAAAVAAREKAEKERDEALLTVKALTPAANYCLEYKPRLLAAEARAEKAERERDAYRHEWNVSSRQQGAETRARSAAEARAERLAGKAKEMDLLLRFAHGFIGSIVECKDSRFVDSMKELTEWTAKVRAALAEEERR